MIPKGVEGDDELMVQAEWVQRWNQLVYSGALDRHGTQEQFVSYVMGPARAGRIRRARG